MSYYFHNYPQIQNILNSKWFFGLQVTISALIGVFIMFPILLPLLLLNEIARVLVRLVLWALYGDEIQLCEDSGSNNYACLPTMQHGVTVLYLAEVEGSVGVQEIRDNYQKHVIDKEGYARMKCTLETHWFYMCMRKCEDFDVANHVRIYPGAEDRVVTEKELMKSILPELRRDMDFTDKPRWEEVLIPNYKPDLTNSSSIKSLRIIRMHHSYMDGMSVLLMVANCFTKDGDKFPYIIDPTKPLKITRVAQFVYRIACVSLMSWYMLINCVAPPFTRKDRFIVDPKNLSEKAIFSWTKKIPLEDFRNIKDRSGVGMAAIISTVLAGAIQKFELKYPCKNSRHPETADVHPLWIVAGMFPYKKDNPRNDHTGIESTMLTSDISGCERLSAMNDELGRLAQHPMATINFWFRIIMGRVPTRIQEELFLQFLSANVILSIVPICTEPLTLWERKCSEIVGWVPILCGCGLGIVTVRYADHFRYCLQAEPSIMTEEQLEYLASQIEEQVQELCLETMNLQRKISTDVSLFERAKKSTGEVRQVDSEEENEQLSRNNNSSLHDSDTSYSFIYKIKDSFDQIRDGIRKIKEQ